MLHALYSLQHLTWETITLRKPRYEILSLFFLIEGGIIVNGN